MKDFDDIVEKIINLAFALGAVLGVLTLTALLVVLIMVLLRGVE